MFEAELPLQNLVAVSAYLSAIVDSSPLQFTKCYESLNIYRAQLPQKKIAMGRDDVK